VSESDSGGSATVTVTGDFKLASVKCLPLKNMEATIVLAANSPSMVQPLLCHSSQTSGFLPTYDVVRQTYDIV
jgi:hypothetical protein